MAKNQDSTKTIVSKPKRTAQGQGKHSKAKPGKKLFRGQGK